MGQLELGWADWVRTLDSFWWALGAELGAVLGFDLGLDYSFEGDLKRGSTIAADGVFPLGCVLVVSKLSDPELVIVLQVLRLNALHFTNPSLVWAMHH